MRRNNRKKAYQLVKDFTTLKQGKATTIQNCSGKCLTEEQEILNWWTQYCSELYNHKAKGDPYILNCPRQTQKMTTPSFAKKWRLQYTSKKGKSAGVDNIPAEVVQNRWRGHNLSHNNLQQDLADRRMANPVEPVLGCYTSQERQPAAEPELLNDHPPKQSHAEDHTEQIEAANGEENRQTSEQEGAPESRSSTLESSVRNISCTSKTSTLSS